MFSSPLTYVWGRNGFDGIASVVERHIGFRAPVKRSEKQQLPTILRSHTLPDPAAARVHRPAWGRGASSGGMGPRLLSGAQG